MVPAPGAAAVIAPHLDDASLSCGALLSRWVQDGTRVTSVTVFDGPPPQPVPVAAARFHAECGLGDDAMTVRAAEDDRAMARLGVRTVRFGLREALYRVTDDGQPRYPVRDRLFATPVTEEPELVVGVAARLAGCAEFAAADVVLAPLGIGGHIDHLVVGAAVRVARDAGRETWWYEDIPYVTYRDCADWTALVGGLVPVVAVIRVDTVGPVLSTTTENAAGKVELPTTSLAATV